jgi:hypothetical protein
VTFTERNAGNREIIATIAQSVVSQL